MRLSELLKDIKCECIKGKDILWYIWTNANSPVFGKDKMATFERYLIEDKETHVEKKNKYYELIDDEATVSKIDELQNILLDSEATLEEKNNA